MRDYTNFDRHLDNLAEDVYPQPPDDKQLEYGKWVIDNWGSLGPRKSVLDVGCGQGQFAELFQARKMRWVGITLGSDYDICKERGLEVYNQDFSFLSNFGDESFDLIFSRHSLEHSPFPLLSLMEWRRVSKEWLIVILPNPDGELGQSHVGPWRGRNHYSVMTKSHFLWLANRAGWGLYSDSIIEFEMRFMLRKGNEIKE